MRVIIILLFFLLLPIALAYQPCEEVIPGYKYSAQKGTLPHIEAYKVDPVTDEQVVFGYCFYTHEVLKEEDVIPQEILVGLDVAETITGYKMIEAKGYKPYLLFDTDWPDQVIGRNIRTTWEYGEDFEEFLPKHAQIETTAKKFLEEIQGASTSIANLYITPEVFAASKAYILHTQQVQQLRDEQKKTVLREERLKPSQDHQVQLAIDRQVSLLQDPEPVPEQKITGAVTLTTPEVTREQVFWFVAVLMVVGVAVLLLGFIRSLYR